MPATTLSTAAKKIAGQAAGRFPTRHYKGCPPGGHPARRAIWTRSATTLPTPAYNDALVDNIDDNNPLIANIDDPEPQNPVVATVEAIAAKSIVSEVTT